MIEKKEIDVSVEANDVSEAVVSLVESIKKHGADGFQAGTDIPVIILENMQSVKEAIDGVDQLDEEAEEDLGAFINSFTSMVGKLITIFKKK